MQQIAAAFPGRQIDLTLKGDLRGRWDSGRVDQVLSNLVLNALRYGDREGPVRVEESGTPNEVTFSVVDRGPMISPSTLAQMFEPLKRGTGRSEDDGNLGLGLYICREITRAHGGAITRHPQNPRLPSWCVFRAAHPALDLWTRNPEFGPWPTEQICAV